MMRWNGIYSVIYIHMMKWLVKKTTILAYNWQHIHIISGWLHGTEICFFPYIYTVYNFFSLYTYDMFNAIKCINYVCTF